MNKEQNALIDYLQQIRLLRMDMMSRMKDKPLYYGIEDFILRHGRMFSLSYLPRHLPVKMRGAVRQCFANAGRVARDHSKDFIYTEGFSFASSIPFHHAWVVSPEGIAYELTWEREDLQDNEMKYQAYYGVAFKPEFCKRIYRESKCWGLLDDWQNHWPILRGLYPFDEMLHSINQESREMETRK